MGLVLAREIHFDWTDAGIYIGLIVLLGIASLKYDALKDHLDTPWVINLVVIGLFTYVLSQTIDQRWWRGLRERILYTYRWKKLWKCWATVSLEPLS